MIKSALYVERVIVLHRSFFMIPLFSRYTARTIVSSIRIHNWCTGKTYSMSDTLNNFPNCLLSFVKLLVCFFLFFFYAYTVSHIYRVYLFAVFRLFLSKILSMTIFIVFYYLVCFSIHTSIDSLV